MGRICGCYVAWCIRDCYVAFGAWCGAWYYFYCELFTDKHIECLFQSKALDCKSNHTRQSWALLRLSPFVLVSDTTDQLFNFFFAENDHQILRLVVYGSILFTRTTLGASWWQRPTLQRYGDFLCIIWMAFQHAVLFSTSLSFVLIADNAKSTFNFCRKWPSNCDRLFLQGEIPSKHLGDKSRHYNNTEIFCAHHEWPFNTLFCVSLLIWLVTIRFQHFWRTIWCHFYLRDYLLTNASTFLNTLVRLVK